MSSPAPQRNEAFLPFTKAERIQQLNDIDKSITELLRCAGLALQILAASEESHQTVVDRQKAFETSTRTYFSTLQSVDVGLRRQIWGLEEAGIITDKRTKDSQEPKNVGEGKLEKDSYGKLDIGWLNSRSGRVGRDNETELWAKARKFLEGINDSWRPDGDGDEDLPMGN